MQKKAPHTFHIPVMGLGFTVDTPIKVARYGISSVVSIMEDFMIEDMRKAICLKHNIPYIEISDKEDDYRAKRITAYLDLMQDVITTQIEEMQKEEFVAGSELYKYFSLLPDNSAPKKLFTLMLTLEKGWLKDAFIQELMTFVKPGAIDVNIMTKVDRTTFNEKDEPMPPEFSDASSSLRGFCQSKIESSVIFSAGMNPRLYSYCEQFSDFYPNEKGELKKKIVLKVSDYRSALIQGKIFAKKGIWVSEYRIESGLNCGGHAFATQGFLLGPILEEFKTKKSELTNELFATCNDVLSKQNRPEFKEIPYLKITAQGGIGNNEEDEFLLEHFDLDGTGWGSPFLLVPETTNVDEATLTKLINAQREDFYLSDSSPLGVLFHNFKHTTSDDQRINRIEKNRPGSPCYRKFLAINTEFTEKPICTASRQYQKLKIAEIEESSFSAFDKQKKINNVLIKECLCEGLGTSARLNNHTALSHKLTAVSICPGPNLSFFGNTYKLSEMVDHIYGRINLMFKRYRPHMFINEAQLYLDYLKKETEDSTEFTEKRQKYFEEFKRNLENGLNYYSELSSSIQSRSVKHLENFKVQIDNLKIALAAITIQTKCELS